MTVRGDFGGTDRFAIVRRVGAGGMGVVYEAWDREREQTVAVKCLRHVDPVSLLFFKREFRSLADVAHPNLVVLHELESVGEDWFFSMEYVDGVDFYCWVRDGERAVARRYTSHDAATEVSEDATAPPATHTITGTGDSHQMIPARVPRSLDLAQIRRLRDALRQLCEGVAAIHAAGKLHRDIKPSNALVTPQGRVVLLDFGLIVDAESLDTAGRHVVGTPAYMAPEQGSGEAPSRAADWYSVGVVLYECLTGRLPFVGSPIEIMLDKHRHDPPPPAEIVDGIPADLDRLCRQLLGREPDDRPSERDILRAVGAHHIDGAAGLYALRTSASLGVGRERELAELAAAFTTAASGRSVTMHVRGPSGMGKTALVRRFLEELRRERRAEILAGRCYERESVPYKALDPVMDELARILATLPRERAAALLPADVKAVARLFPVLSRVSAIADAPEIGDGGDLQQLRRRAFDALRLLLARFAGHAPLVVHIDDLHWSDADSAALLDDVLGGPGAPAVLLILAYRAGEAMPVELLARVGEVRVLDVAPLPPEDARRLAERLLGDSDLEVASVIAAESRGNPLFVAELARAYRDGGAVGRDLETVLADRIGRLPDEARLLLELIATASGPVPRGVVRRASRLERAEYTAAAVLGAGRLIRSSGARDTDTLEVYHDSIRRAVVQRLSPEVLVEHHRALAVALAAIGAEPERLVFHYRGAGDTESAVRYAEQAAARADEALAFDRAAELYRLCLELRGTRDPSMIRPMRIRLAEALVNAGRGREAADELMTAAVGTSLYQARELKRRAMEQYLRAGHLDQAMTLLREVLDLAGLHLPSTPARALPSLMVGRARIAVRGLRWRRRHESEIAPEELTRVDTAWSVANVLGMADAIRGAEFQARHLLLALDVGEPKRVARALATQATYMSWRGASGRNKAPAVLAEARRALAGIDDPRSHALVVSSEALVAFLDGRWRDALVGFDAAQDELMESCRGVIWELNIIRSFALWCIGYLGRLDELAQRAERYRRDARDRGDRYALCALVGAMPNLAWLVQDDVAGARELMAEAIRQWPSDGFLVQHYYELMAATHADLYSGDGPGAYARIAQRWPAVRRSLLLQIQQIRLELLFCRARAALAAAAAGDRSALSVALEDAERLAGEDARRGRATADLVRAGAMILEGRRGEAVEILARAAQRFDLMDMSFHAAVARRGMHLSGGADERAAEIEVRLRAQGVRRPARLCSIFLPVLARDSA